MRKITCAHDILLWQGNWNFGKDLAGEVEFRRLDHTLQCQSSNSIDWAMFRHETFEVR